MTGYTVGAVTVHHGDCLDVLRELPDASVDAVVTDPPYGLEFMGKEWDSFAPARTQYHGERADTSKSIRNDDRKPSSRHGVSYAMGRPTFRRCADCGKREFSGTPCKCDNPTWLYEQPTGTPTRMAAFQAWCETWAAECLRVLKPGGHLLAFGGTRTSHRLASGIEDAGFEIRDALVWLYGSGFPKSLDVGKAIDRAAGATREIVGKGRRSQNRSDGWDRPWMREQMAALGGSGMAEHDLSAPATDDARRWNGWGTALKPGHEPIVLARKPLTGTVAANVLAHGTGALNIDGCRIASSDEWSGNESNAHEEYSATVFGKFGRQYAKPSHDLGRWPANVVLDDAAAAMLDQQSGETQSRIGTPRGAASGDGWGMTATGAEYDDTGGASRFYYTAKADTRERPTHYKEGAGEGRIIEGASGKTRRCVVCGNKTVRPPETQPACGHGEWEFVPTQPRPDRVAHPTVKPLDLMRWLIRLITPPGGTVLDPFAGSGTTGEACILEGVRCVLIEREADYLPLIRQRLDRRLDPVAHTTATRRPDDQPDLFTLLDGQDTP